MKTWLQYNSDFTFSHKLEDDGLVDKFCTKIHTHEDAHLVVSVRNVRPFLDFKLLKEYVERAKTIFLGKTISGHCSAEVIAESLAQYTYSILEENDFETDRVKVQLWETEKYGVEIIWRP